MVNPYKITLGCYVENAVGKHAGTKFKVLAEDLSIIAEHAENYNGVIITESELGNFGFVEYELMEGFTKRAAFIKKGDDDVIILKEESGKWAVYANEADDCYYSFVLPCEIEFIHELQFNYLALCNAVLDYI